MQVFAAVILILLAAGVAKMVYDVQELKKVKAQAERMQELAGIEVPPLDTPIPIVEGIMQHPVINEEVVQEEETTIYKG